MATISLTKQFIFDTLGNGSISWMAELNSIRSSLITYYTPWVAFITFILNLVVFLLCIAIYTKTKKKNHKPAFLYIGVLALFDLAVAALILPGRDEEYETQVQGVIGFSINVLMQWSSFNTLAVLTIDRYIFIKKPLHYPLIMTPCKTWLLLLAGLVIALLLGILTGFTIQAPSSYVNGQFCTWVNFIPYWLQIVLSLVYFTVLNSLICIYAVVLAKFRESRKKLELLQKSANQETFTESNLTFKKIRWFFKKEVLPEIPIANVQVLSVKGLSESQGNVLTQDYQKRKRRPSSVARKMAVLASHAKAATYILILVVTLLVSWAPFNLYSLYESIGNLVQPEKVHINSTVNGTMLHSCFKSALQNNECHIEEVFNVDQQEEYEERIKTFAHVLTSAFIEYVFGICFPLLNALLNPILYAVWYVEFRTYIVQIPDWFRKKKQEPDDFKFEMQIIKA